jgi:hypothetical protein
MPADEPTYLSAGTRFVSIKQVITAGGFGTVDLG